MAKPIKVTPEITAQLTFNPKESVLVGGIWGTICAGQNYMASDGIRQVVHADNFQIFYFQNGFLWGQQAQSFINEIRIYPAIRGAQGAVGMAMLAEFQINILLGIVASSSIVGCLIVVGTDVFKFLLTNKYNFGKWCQAMEAILKARSILKAKAPTLYQKVFEGFLKQLWSAISSGMPAALSKPDTAGKLTGLMIGKFGKVAAKTQFTVFGAIWILFSTVATKLITSVPSAINVTIGDYKKLAQDLINQLRTIGLSISHNEIQNIFREIAKNPREIKKVFSDLESEFKKAGLCIGGV